MTAQQRPGTALCCAVTPFPSQGSPIPVRSTVAALPVNDQERKIRHMIPGDNFDHGESPMLTEAERVAAHRARRHKNLVQRTVTIAESDLNFQLLTPERTLRRS